MEQVLQVSQLNQYVKTLLEGQTVLRRVTLRGEISNFTDHFASGHLYFSLKDSRSSIRAVMFRSHAVKLQFQPENGMSVLATGSVRLYERDGSVQLYCERLQPEGIGALAMAFEQRKQKLAALGWFDPARKRPLPAFPRRIGVVTSKTGAALQDILNILSRRYPLGEVVLFDTLVQGNQAAESIALAIGRAAKASLDVLIVGRGGGSMEDLWCFNEEVVAKAILDCPVPVISAVGHEVDFTIADFVADLRAPTPSAAAELCAPDVVQIREQLETYAIRLDTAVEEQLEEAYLQLERMKKRLQQSSPNQQMMRQSQLLDSYGIRLRQASPEQKILHLEQELLQKKDRLNQNLTAHLEHREWKLQQLGSLLDALSPLKVLTRGYSITTCDGKIVTNTQSLQEGSILETTLAGAVVRSSVLSWEETNQYETKIV